MEVQHYEKDGFEAVDFIEFVLERVEMRSNEAWLLGNALKYAMRAGKKDGEPWTKDACKCADYMNRLVNGEWIG